MKKFLLYVDYYADSKDELFDSGYDYSVIECGDFETAIETAEKWWNLLQAAGKKIYLMRIFKKCGASVMESGHHSTPYTAVLCKRSAGWHKNTEFNAEGRHSVNLCWYGRYKENGWWIENTTYRT